MSGGIDPFTFYANLRFKNLTLICGNTTDRNIQNKIKLNGPYDLIFIDGGHDYETVKSDFVNFSKLVSKNGVIVFHDIMDCDVPKGKKGVPDFWKEIKKNQKQYTIKEFYDPHPVTKTGIGVLVKK